MLAMFFQSIVRGIASIKRLNMVLDCKPAVVEANINILKEIIDSEEDSVEKEIGTVERKLPHVSFHLGIRKNLAFSRGYKFLGRMWE